MNVSGMIRRGGLAAVAGAALFLIADAWTLVEEYIIGGPERLSEQAMTTSWTFVSVMFLARGILLMIGLVALYARQAEAAGVLGLVGFLLTFVLMAMIVGAMWTFTFVAPSAAIEAPAFLDNENPSGPLMVGFMLSFMIFPLGWLLFGIATFRARVFPKLAGGLLAVGALVAFAPLPAATLLLDIAVIWLGYSLFSERRERATEGLARSEPDVQPQAH